MCDKVSAIPDVCEQQPEPWLTSALNSLRERLIERMAFWTGTSVRDACSLDPAFPDAAPSLLTVFVEHRTALALWLDRVTRIPTDGGMWPTDPAGFLARRTMMWLQGRNQFLDLDRGRQATLATLYRRAAHDICIALNTIDDATGGVTRLRTAIEAVFARHQRRLVTFLFSLDRATVQGPGFVFQEAVCAEYPATLQLRLLGLDIATLPEPILDLGCGEHCGLVRALRARGKYALGVDRLAAVGDGVSVGDWFSIPLAPKMWGTIISHLGFSHHFNHHHLCPGGEVTRYAQRYMAILRALRPAGSFIYAPGLPFIEDLLPTATYQVTRRLLPVIGPATGHTLPSSSRVPALYTTRVARLS